MNYTFTFITEQEYHKAKSTGYIEKYDLMRIEIYDENGMMIGDYPVHTMEEFIICSNKGKIKEPEIIKDLKN